MGYMGIGGGIFNVRRMKMEGWNKVGRQKGSINCAPIKDRLLDNIEIITESGCWIWKLKLINGCGRISIKGKYMPAHRLSYREFNGDFPDKLHVLHRCDVPSCINPNHLFLGTHEDNMADMKKKGRGGPQPMRKFTSKEALEIKDSKETHKELCKKYGASARAIASIKANNDQAYKYIKVEI